MVRKPNTDRQGYPFSLDTINGVWAKGREIPKFHSGIWRWDKCGLVMSYEEHGNRQSEHGWEVDHINPVSNSGNDYLNNLQPLNWKNNANKGDSLIWSCP